MNMRLAGLWIGMYVAQTYVFIYFYALLRYASWREQVNKAQNRIDEECASPGLRQKLLKAHDEEEKEETEETEDAKETRETETSERRYA